MFNVQGSELIFLLLVALVVLGPEKLPEAVRRFGRMYAQFKKAADGFQGEFRQVFEEPARELRGTADALRNAVRFDLDEPTAPPPDRAPASPAVSGITRPAGEQRATELDFGELAADSTTPDPPNPDPSSTEQPS